ncbi:hypothetical protein C5167_018450 [Papaver somniferum]|uniref:Uncharacterized protein n=1 Tax=Papaver somniferum TaxID=3469 RepID=A0A4Y7IMA7_PAPSO|nr:hypothetical protein C5167_018450 [Papaver somniferum]
MGKSGNKKGGGGKSGFVNGSNLGGGLTLGQQIHGRGGNHKNNISSRSNSNVGRRRSLLKTKHLEKLALSAGGHVSIPSLGALFGQRLASCSESMATPVDSSLFLCQRCESILQPGSNCTVRIEKHGTMKEMKWRKNSSGPPQNKVVYTCNFCSHRNLKRGTSKNHMKEILPPRMRQVKCDEKHFNLVKSRAGECKVDLNVEAIVCPDNVAGFKEEVVDQIHSKSENVFKSNKEIGKTAQELVPIAIVESEATVPEMNYLVCKDVASENSPTTPLNSVPLLLLDAKRRKRNKSNNKQVATVSDSKTTDVEKVSGSSTKRRRKSWSSLKELAEANVRKNDTANIIIPFRL